MSRWMISYIYDSIKKKKKNKLFDDFRNYLAPIKDSLATGKVLDVG